MIVFQDKDDTDATSLELYFSDLKTMLDALPAGTHLHVKFREWKVCVDDTDMYAVFVSSAPYTKT